jgi:hypothetical protein
MSAQQQQINKIAPAFIAIKECLDIYIPRVDALFTEQDVRNVFWNEQLGVVEYVDFVKVKVEEKKEEEPEPVVLYSAFVKMVHWFTQTAVDDITTKGSHKVFLNNAKYWLLLPNKTPLARSKINIHQLAFNTDEIYAKFLAQGAKILEQDETIKAQNKHIDDQYVAFAETKSKHSVEVEDLRAELAELKAEQQVNMKRLYDICMFQNGQITELQSVLSTVVNGPDEDEDDDEQQPDLHIEDLISEDQIQHDNTDYDDLPDLLEELMIDDELPPQPVLERRTSIYTGDVSREKKTRTPSPEIEKRSEISRDLCGNA